MVTLVEFLSGTKATTKNMAGYLSAPKPGEKDKDYEFRYLDSVNPRLPAFVNVLCDKKVPKNAKIYTNYDTAPWPKSIVDSIKGLSSFTPENADGARPIKPVLLTTRNWPSQVCGSNFAAPLPEGGLVEAARTASATTAENSRKRGLQRALRYYMLASYALIDISREESFKGLKNYVGALMVSDTGKILAAGINTGSFRHAEVSLLISYFRNNPLATSIPTDCVIFSTLTPCVQCTRYLEESMSSPRNMIYFGQTDTGKDGKVGMRISDRLADKTKAPQGRVKGELTGALKQMEDDGVEENDSPVVCLATTGAVHKVKMAAGLSGCMGGGSIATSIGKSADAKKVIAGASEALIHKMLKERTGGNAETDVKQAALTYIGQYLGTARILA